MGLLLATVALDYLTVSMLTRIDVDKGVIDTSAGRPVIKTGVHVSRDLSKYAAGNGNRFSVDGLPSKGRMLEVARIDCAPGSVAAGKNRGGLLVGLRSDFAGVNRMMMANAKARRHVASDPIPISIVATGSLDGTDMASLSRTLRGLAPSFSDVAGNVKAALDLGKLPSSCFVFLRGNGHLCKSSACTQVGITGVGHVRVLGNTSSTLCKAGTVKKIVGVVASSTGGTVGISDSAHCTDGKHFARSMGVSIGANGFNSCASCHHRRTRK